jgi:hypothetical protein
VTSPDAVPRAIGGRVHATREATRDLWGNLGVERVLARLDDDALAAFLPQATAQDWLPESTYMTWMHAVWDGPCAHDAAGFARWVDRVTDRGFGKARGMLMALASPWVILRRANALWRAEHTHGDLAIARVSGRAARFELARHPYVGDPVASAAVSESCWLKKQSGPGRRRRSASRRRRLVLTRDASQSRSRNASSALFSRASRPVVSASDGPSGFLPISCQNTPSPKRARSSTDDRSFAVPLVK